MMRPPAWIDRCELQRRRLESCQSLPLSRRNWECNGEGRGRRAQTHGYRKLADSEVVETRLDVLVVSDSLQEVYKEMQVMIA